MKVIVDELAVHYTDEGEGPIVLMLHGWSGNLHSFDAVCANLLPEYRVIRLDLPGFGSTDASADAWDVEKYARFVCMFLEKINVQEPYALVGHSFGGRIMLKGVGLGVMSAQKLVFIGAAGVSKSKSLGNRVLGLLAPLGRVVRALPLVGGVYGRFRKSMYRRLGSDYLSAGALTETYKLVVAEDLQQHMADVKQDSLLIWGAHDTQTPITDAEIFDATLPNSTLVVLPDGDHFVHEREADEVTTLLKRFFHA